MEGKTNYQRIRDIFLTDEQTRKFLIMSALTFRLHLDSLSEVLGIDEKSIYDMLMKKTGDYYKFLDFLFNNDGEDQEKAKVNFNYYLGRLIIATRSRNNEMLKELLSEIADKSAKALMNREPGSPISEEDIKIMLKHQIKYSLSVTSTANSFNSTKEHYCAIVKKFFDAHPEEIELKRSYEYLADFYSPYRGGDGGR